MRRAESGLFSGLALAILIGFALACGGGGGGGDGITYSGTSGLGADSEGRSYVGTASCIACHQDFSWSKAIVEDFLTGGHVIHNTHIEASSEAACLACHDPIGDGPGIEQYIAAADIPDEGLAAVGCENCHGAGGEHYGTGPMPVATPDLTTCEPCHNSTVDHSRHPEGYDIYENYLVSKHAESGNHNSLKCVKCHTAEGGKAYKDIDDYNVLLVAALPFETVTPIDCNTCHNPHGGLLKDGTDDASDQYNTCANCHGTHDAKLADWDDPADPADYLDAEYVAYAAELAALVAAEADDTTDKDAGDLLYHSKRWNRVISNTHYDRPDTSYEAEKARAAAAVEDMVQANVIIEGYTMDPTNEHVCLDCHDVHVADTTINNDWARSGHGGEILEAKELAEHLKGADHADERREYTEIIAIRDAGADGATNAWPHYDWDAPNRASCAMCHTSTGAKNQLDSMVTLNEDPEDYVEYDADNNDFSHLLGWVGDDPDTPADEGVSSGQNELLFCWACHADNSGALREAGPITLPSFVYDADRNPATDNDADVVLPDVGDSNVCLNCHAGRGNVTSILTASRSSRAKAHHGAAAATVFSAVTHAGYEYDGLDYANKSYFAHDVIGTVDADGNEVEEGTGTSGPCVGCHMPSGSHLFDAVTTVPSDEDHPDLSVDVRDSISNQALCDACHSTHGVMTLAVVDEQKAGFVNALLLLENYLKNAPANYLGLDIHTTGNDNYKTVAMGAYGAFQNYKYLSDEPGAFTHNRFYAQRLIFDSIDWLDNGVLDGTIDLTGYAAARTWYDEDAEELITAIPRP